MTTESRSPHESHVHSEPGRILQSSGAATAVSMPIRATKRVVLLVRARRVVNPWRDNLNAPLEKAMDHDVYDAASDECIDGE